MRSAAIRITSIYFETKTGMKITTLANDAGTLLL
jgi:hypothetical protein